MYGKILNLKFSNMDEAQLAASFFSENIGQKISDGQSFGPDADQ